MLMLRLLINWLQKVNSAYIRDFAKYGSLCDSTHSKRSCCTRGDAHTSREEWEGSTSCPVLLSEERYSSDTGNTLKGQIIIIINSYINVSRSNILSNLSF